LLLLEVVAVAVLKKLLLAQVVALVVI